MTTAVQQPVPVQVSYDLCKNDSKNSSNHEGSSSSVSSTSSVSVPSRPSIPAFHRSASSPSMNTHCWQLKTSLNNAGIPSNPLQPIIKEIKTGSSKDDTDISPEDIIVDPKTHHTFRKGRLIGKGGFAKVIFYVLTYLDFLISSFFFV